MQNQRKQVSQRTVLVVDGDPMESLSIKRGFEMRHSSCKLHFCRSAGEAIRYLAHCRRHGMPDAVLLDVERDCQMAMGLIQRLRALGMLDRFPVFVLTRNENSHDRARKLGASGCVCKPRRNRHLDERVADFVDRHLSLPN